MKAIAIILFLGFNLPASTQKATGKQIFSDTSLYFIHQPDSLNPISLSPEELALAGELFLKAVKEYNEHQQRLSDSLYRKKKKKQRYVRRIDINNYLFRLDLMLIGDDQKRVFISSDCKEQFSTGTKGGVVVGNWKQGFID